MANRIASGFGQIRRRGFAGNVVKGAVGGRFEHAETAVEAMERYPGPKPGLGGIG